MREDFFFKFLKLFFTFMDFDIKSCYNYIRVFGFFVTFKDFFLNRIMG